MGASDSLRRIASVPTLGFCGPGFFFGVPFFDLLIYSPNAQQINDSGPALRALFLGQDDSTATSHL